MLKPSFYNIYLECENAIWIYNSASGALCKDACAKTPIEAEIRMSENSRQEKNSLLALNNFLVASSEDEVQNIQARLEKAKVAVDSLSVTIAPTLGCNFSCAYCFERKTKAWKDKNVMSDQVVRDLKNYIVSNLKGRKGLHIRWFGGEPLLAMEKLEEISKDLIKICDLSEISYAAEIQTNGYHLTSDVSTRLRDARISVIHVTLDGGPEDHNRIRYTASGDDSFSRILTNLETVPDDIQIVIRVNVTEGKIHNINSLVNELACRERLKRSHVYFYPIYSFFNGTNNTASKAAAGFSSVKEFAEHEVRLQEKMIKAGYRFSWGFLEPKNLPCSAVKLDGVMIDVDGSIIKCDHEFGRGDAALGHVRTGMRDLKKLMDWTNVTPKNNPYCPSCPLLPTCLGNCASLRKHLQPEEACPPKRYNYLQMLRLGIASLNGCNKETARFGDYSIVQPSILALRQDC